MRFAFPQLDDEDLARVYTTHYYPSIEESHPVKYESTPDLVLRQVLPQLEAFFGSLKGLRLLDYGCGRGPLSRIAYELGIAPVGIDPDPVARCITAGRLGVDAYPNLRELRSQKPAAQFDLIVLWNVIEHLREPWSDLRELRALLRPNGRLLISTMNVECLRARVERGRWICYENPTHLYYFDRRSLERVIGSAGFREAREWKPKICYPSHGTMRRLLYEASSLVGLSDGVYYLCSADGNVRPARSPTKTYVNEETVHVGIEGTV